MRGRPEKTEAAEYYFTYIGQVEGDDPIAAMREQLEAWPAHLDEFRQVRSATLWLFATCRRGRGSAAA